MFWTFGNLRYFSKFYKLKGKLFEEVLRWQQCSRDDFLGLSTTKS